METCNTFSVDRDSLWRKTLDDGILYFQNAQPSIVEKSQEELKKSAAKADDKYELSEANCIRILDQRFGQDIEQSKFYCYSLNKKIYKAIEVKKDCDNKPTFVRLVEHGSSEELVLGDQDCISALRDYIDIFIRIYTENVSNFTISTSVKLNNKLEVEVGEVIQGAIGIALSSFKFFKDSKFVNKESFISSLDNIKDGMEFVAMAGLSKPSIFRRFGMPSEYKSWGHNGRYLDAITFIPNQNVIVSGFSLYAAHDYPTVCFECTYKIYINDNLVEEQNDVLTCTDYEEKYYCRIKTKQPIEVQAGSNLEVVVRIAKEIATCNDDYVFLYTYVGRDGENFAQVENEHMGLWTVKYSSKTQDSGLGTGNIPEIIYHL